MESKETSLRLSCLCSDLILSVRTRKLRNCVDYTVRTEFTGFSVIIKMVNTHNVRNGAENSQGNGNPSSPPSLAQAIASILVSCDEQTELLRQLVANSTRGGNGARNAPAPAPTTYSNFTATHLPLFTEVQKTLFTAQHLRGDASAWWVNYTATHPADYQCRGLSSAMPSAPTTSPPA
jgi:hypothetical protein